MLKYCATAWPLSWQQGLALKWLKTWPSERKYILEVWSKNSTSCSTANRLCGMSRQRHFRCRWMSRQRRCGVYRHAIRQYLNGDHSLLIICHEYAKKQERERHWVLAIQNCNGWEKAGPSILKKSYMLKSLLYHWLQRCCFRITIGLTNMNHNVIGHTKASEESQERRCVLTAKL